jgi:hypothetical protein
LVKENKCKKKIEKLTIELPEIIFNDDVLKVEKQNIRYENITEINQKLKFKIEEDENIKKRKKNKIPILNLKTIYSKNSSNYFKDMKKGKNLPNFDFYENKYPLLKKCENFIISNSRKCALYNKNTPNSLKKKKKYLKYIFFFKIF